MNVAVQGTKEFNDYFIFMRGMSVILSDAGSILNVYSAGPAQINSFASEFINKTENTLKLNGIKVKLFRVPPSYIESNISFFDNMLFFSNPNQRIGKLATFAELSGVDVKVFRY